MNALCQMDAIQKLLSASNSKRHSILIEGCKGSGKTYLARKFAQFLDIPDFVICYPKVDEVKETIHTCYLSSTPVVICIENIDDGSLNAAYALLKFLEEPLSTVYIVVTCRDVTNIPDTILSRCVTINIAPPTQGDISSYCAEKYPDTAKISDNVLLQCATSFSHVDDVMKLNSSQISYICNLSNMMKFNDTVSNIVWRLNHYEDNSEAPLDIVLNYLIHFAPTNHIKKAAIECAKEYSASRISISAILSKFAFECKYCE